MRKKIEVKISTQGRRRSTSACFMTIEKRLTRAVLIISLTSTCQRHI